MTKPGGVMAGNERIIDKLRKVLALCDSPIEGEAQAAAETLKRLLTEYNLSIADLEARGAQQRPGVKEDSHDLGKAAFTWKLDLAEAIAEHYYCWPMVDRYAKTVKFIGRPDNVDSLKMLYAWVIDQIKRISADARAQWQHDNQQHIDPLRWQVNFGLGAVQRLAQRLTELRERATSKETALVLSHKSEISDYMEQHYGTRVDGQKTKAEQQWQREREEREALLRKLKEVDIDAYYEARPWERPLTPEQQAAKEKEEAAYWKRQERNAARRRGGNGRRGRAIDWEKEQQAAAANRSGRANADKVNLEPFLQKHADSTKGQLD